MEGTAENECETIMLTLKQTHAYAQHQHLALTPKRAMAQLRAELVDQPWPVSTHISINC